MANRIHSIGPFRHDEAKAGEAGIYPGMQVKFNSDGDVIKHSTEGGEFGDEMIFADEDALQGKTVSQVYTSGDIVSLIIPAKGTVLNLLIIDEEDIAIGDKIISDGTGKFKEVMSLPSDKVLGCVVGVAAEANDLTGSNTSDTLSAVRII